MDVCEAGFPMASDGDFRAVERIAKEVGPLTHGRKKPMVRHTHTHTHTHNTLTCDLYHHHHHHHLFTKTFYQMPAIFSHLSLSQIICGLARAIPSDIQKAFDAVKYAPHYRIHTFLATSDIHLEHKLKISREECIKRATAVRERNHK